MHDPRFSAARLIYTYDPAVKKHSRIVGGFSKDHLRTVNNYLSWLRKLGVGYELRLNSQGVYLVKSKGLSEALRP